jgi:hypothetical protein
METGGANPDNYQVGSVRVVPAHESGMPSGLEILSLAKDGVTVSETSLSLNPAGVAFRSFAELSGAVQTALAIANPSLAAVTANPEVTGMEADSAVLLTTIGIPAGGQVIGSLRDWFPQISGDFQGVIRLRTSSPVVVTSWRQRINERGDLLLSTTAPEDESALPAPGATLVFPHLLSGGSYTTEVVIFADSPGNTALGELLWYTPPAGRETP